MSEPEKTLHNEFSGADTGGAQPRRIRIRFKGPAPPAPCPGVPPCATTDGDQCLKATLNTCQSLKRKRIADNGIETSCDAQRVSGSPQIPEFSNKSRRLSSNTLMSSEQEDLCRLMRCNTPTKGRKRSQLKRSKRSSSTKRPSSIDALPDVVLVEILCRLPCYKFVYQCKSVSKRWCTLIADPYFIGRFGHIQSCKRIPIIRTLINERGEEFPPKLLSSPKLLTPVLKRIKSFHRLIRKPVVVATYNDLVLCCATEYDQRDYYICNAYTQQWVALPPIPGRCHRYVQVGLICDTPDYNYENDDWKGHNIQPNADFRCRVVRILPPDEFYEKEKKCDSFKLNVEIFTSETGEWREFVVPSPQRFELDDIEQPCFAYNGMLYWAGDDEFFLIGLGPFNFNKSSSSSSYGDGIIDDKLRLTVYQDPRAKYFGIEYLGVCRGCVRMCYFSHDSRKLHVWELKEQDHDQMVDEATGKLCLSKHKVYSLDRKILPGNEWQCYIKAFDPNNKDILYLRVKEDIIKCNIRTKKWSKIVEKCPVKCGYRFPVVLPRWPTPVPRLPQHYVRTEKIKGHPKYVHAGRRRFLDYRST